MTNNGNMEKSRSHRLIYLTFPVLHQYITAALNQLIESSISKYEYFLYNANELYDDIFTIIISIYNYHNHLIYNDNINIH